MNNLNHNTTQPNNTTLDPLTHSTLLPLLQHLNPFNNTQTIPQHIYTPFSEQHKPRPVFNSPFPPPPPSSLPLAPQVIKAKGNGNYVPEEVPGVMLPTEDGEEAFVPENLLEDTELLLTAGSAQQPTYVSPESPATPVST